MDIEIQLGPGSSAAKVSLESGETLTAEGGSMIAMSSDMSLTTSTYKKNKGGVLKALKRMVSGESFFMNHYEPGSNGGNVYLATALPGDMMTMELNGQGLVVQGGSYVASSHDMSCESGSMRGLDRGERGAVERRVGDDGRDLAGDARAHRRLRRRHLRHLRRRLAVLQGCDDRVAPRRLRTRQPA